MLRVIYLRKKNDYGVGVLNKEMEGFKMEKREKDVVGIGRMWLDS